MFQLLRISVQHLTVCIAVGFYMKRQKSICYMHAVIFNNCSRTHKKHCGYLIPRYHLTHHCDRESVSISTHWCQCHGQRRSLCQNIRPFLGWIWWKVQYFQKDFFGVFSLEMASLSLGVKLSCVCLMIADSCPKVTYSYPRVTYSDHKVAHSDPKVTYIYPRMTYNDP